MRRPRRVSSSAASASPFSPASRRYPAPGLGNLYSVFRERGCARSRPEDLAVLRQWPEHLGQQLEARRIEAIEVLVEKEKQAMVREVAFRQCEPEAHEKRLSVEVRNLRERHRGPARVRQVDTTGGSERQAHEPLLGERGDVLVGSILDVLEQHGRRHAKCLAGSMEEGRGLIGGWGPVERQLDICGGTGAQSGAPGLIRTQLVDLSLDVLSIPPVASES